jgi:hypothetical protein
VEAVVYFKKEKAHGLASSVSLRRRSVDQETAFAILAILISSSLLFFTVRMDLIYGPAPKKGDKCEKRKRTR